MIRHCMRCGKFLKRAHWDRGYDDQCRDILNQAANELVKEFTPEQVRKAVSLPRVRWMYGLLDH